MVIYIYPLERTPSGKQKGATVTAMVELVGQEIRIETYEKTLKNRLEEIFSTPLIKRVPSKPETHALFHRETVVKPFTEEFFEEIIYSLFRYNLHGVLQK